MLEFIVRLLYVTTAIRRHTEPMGLIHMPAGGNASVIPDGTNQAGVHDRCAGNRPDAGLRRQPAGCPAQPSRFSAEAGCTRKGAEHFHKTLLA